HTGRCPMSAYDAHHLIHRRFLEFEHDGMNIMFGSMGVPLYTNIIRGLPDRFIYQNVRVDLTRVVPGHDPYIFDERHVDVHMVDSSSDEEPVEVASSEPSLEPPNLPSQANNPSLHESDFHTNPPMSYSRGSPASVTQTLSPATSGHEVLPPPGRRFATDVIDSGHIRDFVSPRPQHVPPVSAATYPLSLVSPTAEAQVHRSRPFYRHLRITTRPPKSFRVALEHEECYVPPNDATSGFVHQSPGWDSLSNVGTLEALVEQARTTSCPPHPDEPGPSTWFFAGHKRRAEGLLHSQSANDVAGLPLEVSYSSKAGKRQRLEQWEAKGGFNLGFLHGDVRTKAITDVSMARNSEVEPGVEIMSPLAKKRHAATSPPMPAKKWIFKRQRGNDVGSTAADMDRHFSLESDGLVVGWTASKKPAGIWKKTRKEGDWVERRRGRTRHRCGGQNAAVRRRRKGLRGSRLARYWAESKRPAVGGLRWVKRRGKEGVKQSSMRTKETNRGKEILLGFFCFAEISPSPVKHKNPPGQATSPG
ncbi:hypothetical protein BVRB_8g202100, partial [Beta vulgaris subsp. vulgaris]